MQEQQLSADNPKGGMRVASTEEHNPIFTSSASPGSIGMARICAERRGLGRRPRRRQKKVVDAFESQYYSSSP